MKRTELTLAVAALLVSSLLAGTGAAAVTADGSSPLATGDEATRTVTQTTRTANDAAQTANETANNSTVSVTTGAQLSTVIAGTSAEVQTEYEETAFESSYERANESERAAVVADRAAEVRRKARSIRSAYENATAAYRQGDITRSEYAARLAMLNARARNVLDSAERVEQRADGVSRLELRVQGMNASAFDRTVRSLRDVAGPGPTAVYRQFAGDANGRVEVRTDDGVRIEVESEDGARSREFRQAGDGSLELTVAQSTALERARAALSADGANWTLTRASVHEEDGEYRFEFRQRGATTVGEAQVRVDGSSGAVVRVEEEIERTDEAEPDDERDEDELSLLVRNGTVAPNATVTVQVLAAGRPAANVPVTLDGERVGATGANGTLRVTLPAESAKLRAADGDREGELAFEFEAERGSEDRTLARNLSASATLDDGTATLTVSSDGSAVTGATVTADGERVGTTGSDGAVSFPVRTSAEDVEVRVTKGEFEAEQTYRIQNGSLVADGDFEVDASDAEDEAESDDRDEADDDEREGEDGESPEPADDDALTETDNETDAETEADAETESAPDVAIEESLDDGVVTLTVTNNGSPVSDAALSVNGDGAGTTDAEGRVSFAVSDDESDYDVELVADDLEIRTEYRVTNGRIDRVDEITVN